MLFPPQKENKRKVIVDLALKSGINQYRFVVFDVNSDGRILWNSNQYIRPDSDSMLPNAKKEELLNV